MTYFYDEAQDKLLINGIDDITENAIPITDEQHQSIIDAKMNGQMIFVKNSTIIIQPLKPSEDYDWDGTEWVLNAEQQAAKKAEDIAIMRERINALRDSKINGGVYVDTVGKWIDTDATAERNILSVKASFDLFGDSVGDIAWTCADNSILMINKDTLMLIWQALMTAKTSNHANALRHKAAVEQAVNPLEYDYSGGWTKSYADYLEEQNNV